MLGSGNNLSRGVGPSSDVQPLPQCLPLEPIRLRNQKYTRSGELRRVLGVPGRTSSEDNSFGIAHPRPSPPPPPAATEELKHFKQSMRDTSREAGDRAKKLGESIFKLDKYTEALTSRKRRRNDTSPGERMDAVNLEKVRSHIPRTQDSMAQRSGERKKILGLNKRARASVSDVLGNGRVSALSRQQVTEKDSDSLPGISGETVQIEEKIRRLPVGGEGWETKMKRKRSVATLGDRVMNSDQRAVQPKLTADSKLLSCDTQNYRSKSSSGLSGINRLDASFEPHSPEVGTLSRNEMEPVSFARDHSVLAEQRLMSKGNNRRNLQEDDLANRSSTMLKGKVSRIPRPGAVMAAEPSSRVEPPIGALRGLEQSKRINKMSGLVLGNNHQLQMSAGSSPHGMAQWVGQRPHKNSRTRRANVVSPLIKHAESNISSQGFSTSDFSPRASPGTTGSFSVVDNTSLRVKRELKNASSPCGLSGSEDSGVGNNKPGEHALESSDVTTTQKTGAQLLSIRKNKIHSGHNGDGVWKQGKGGSGSLLIAPGFHPNTVKMENLRIEKPIQNAKIASQKNKRSGRPPAKKLKDRKAYTRLSSNANSVSSDVTGESDDDCEDLFAAANSARKAAADHACSGKFWKKMEYIFASVSSDDMQYMKDQLSFVEELDMSLREATANGYNIMGVLMPKASQGPSDDTVHFSNQASSIYDLSFERLDMRKLNESTPLYKRVLSALIEEDDGEEVVQFGEGKNLFLHYASDDSHCGSCTHIDTETRERDRMESEVESNADIETLKNCLFDRFSCDRNVKTSVSGRSNEQWLGGDGLLHSEIALGNEIWSNSMDQLQTRGINIPNFSSSDSQYQLMSLDDRLLLELQSIGVYPEALPDLAEETISSDVQELKEGVYQQIQNKKKKLEKINMTIQKGKDAERRKIEHLAVDQLVEMAHRKRLASRGSKGSKVHKVSRQVALAFIKRTVARCRKFEETGRSCFADPALQDILVSSHSNDLKSSDNGGSGTASNTYNEPSNHKAEARGTGVVSSTKRREALIDDIIGCASSKVTTPGLDSGGRDREQSKGLRNRMKTEHSNSQQPTRTSHTTGPSSSRQQEEEDIELELKELYSMEETADIGNWFDGLQDIDTMGLEIPMDDLSDVKLLL
ncbi:PREDICTED: uncharacterized protein LOC104814789 isoform X3 [Tarenaya hassleriana]|uniref:uncharacterized protein LOC104814789 isoform X3 n=1 Tax=Tarenaya hassleriana TaxID=28532 RepID=UPI00053C21D9|nr:PREDICTED: uncharacterized protein LOC104814789 isoform X3 [Tarenaya hassleriana]